ncbi:MAG: hypothetical protein H0Z33_11230 [Bacillaceae bacterium]|nr:hypothetical protein [Bacillaceae bacterium]
MRRKSVFIIFGLVMMICLVLIWQYQGYVSNKTLDSEIVVHEYTKRVLIGDWDDAIKLTTGKLHQKLTLFKQTDLSRGKILSHETLSMLQGNVIDIVKSDILYELTRGSKEKQTLYYYLYFEDGHWKIFDVRENAPPLNADKNYSGSKINAALLHQYTKYVSNGEWRKAAQLLSGSYKRIFEQTTYGFPKISDQTIKLREWNPTFLGNVGKSQLWIASYHVIFPDQRKKLKTFFIVDDEIEKIIDVQVIDEK